MIFINSKDIGTTVLLIFFSFFLIDPVFAAEPIGITNCQDLQNIENNLSADYVLANDIDCSGVDFEPIGTYTGGFKGSLDGVCRTISNLKIRWADAPAVGDYYPGMYAGLFGKSSGGIRNLYLENVDIIAGSYAGGLVGSGSANISGVSVSGKLWAIGDYNAMTGGVVGYGEIANISSAVSFVNIYTSGSDTGGIIGLGGRVFDSAFFGSITSDGDNAGGIVGALFSKSGVKNSYSHGSITVSDSGKIIGGLVGYIPDWWQDRSGLYVINSYSAGAVTGSWYGAGGLLGHSNYSGNQTSPGVAQNSYWDVATSGQTTSYAGTGKTTAQMKQQSTFTNWDFSTIWKISPGKYPELIHQGPDCPAKVTACNDGIDNDGDGKADYPADPGCASPFDGDEHNPVEHVMYIDNAASGCNNGSEKYNPATRSCGSGEYKMYTTIQEAADIVTPGDTVYVRAGTYVAFTLKYKQGNPNKWIIFKSYPGEKVIIDQYPLSPGCLGDERVSLLISSSSYIEINGFEFTSSHPSLPVTGGFDTEADCDVLSVRRKGAGHIKIINNYFHDTGGGPISVPFAEIAYNWTVDNVEVSNNIIKNTGLGRKGHGIYMVGSNHVIRGNIIDNAYGNGISLRPWSGFPDTSVVVENNVVMNNGHPDGRYDYGTGVKTPYNYGGGSKYYYESYALDGIDMIYNRGIDNVIRNNLVYNNRGFGIQTSSNDTIFNNTIYNNGFNGINLYGNPSPDAAHIHNNIVYKNGGGAYPDETSIPAGNTVSKNLIGVDPLFNNANLPQGYDGKFWTEDDGFVPLLSESPACGNATEGGDVGAYVCGNIINIPADVNSDGRVNIKDIQACIKVITKSQSDQNIIDKCRVIASPPEVTNIKDIQEIIKAIIAN